MAKKRFKRKSKLKFGELWEETRIKAQNPNSRYARLWSAVSLKGYQCPLTPDRLFRSFGVCCLVDPSINSNEILAKPLFKWIIERPEPFTILSDIDGFNHSNQMVRNFQEHGFNVILRRADIPGKLNLDINIPVKKFKQSAEYLKQSLKDNITVSLPAKSIVNKKVKKLLKQYLPLSNYKKPSEESKRTKELTKLIKAQESDMKRGYKFQKDNRTISLSDVNE